jgi:DNA polymerase-1
MIEKIVLVDGSSYLYRAFHAMPNLMNSKGEPTGAIYGIVNMLRRLRKEHETANLSVVFDAPGLTFRDVLYPEYKANRPPMPKELRAQISTAHTVIEAMGLPILCVDGVEADDVIGTLATQAASSGLDVSIISGDKDFAQLVDNRITLVDTMKDVAYDRLGVEKKFGVSPEQIVDFLALVGDSSDNIPGVPKVGPKTACKWLQQYGSLDEVIQHAEQIPGKVGENLRASLNQLPLTRELATIKRDVQLDQTPAELSPVPPDLDRLRQLYAHLEFKSWLSELGGAQDFGLDQDGRGTEYEIILDKNNLESWINRLERAAYFVLDTETTSLNVMQAEIVGLSFTDKVGCAAYLPFVHDYVGAPAQLQREPTLERLRPLLENEDIIKVGQNLKYDRSVLLNHGIQLRGIRFDTMLESYVLNSTGSRHDMDSLALKYLGHNTITFEEIAGKGKSQLVFNKIELEKSGPYAAEDADITLRLHQHLHPQLKKQPELLTLFEDIEIPLIPVLSTIERTGVRVDVDMLITQSAELAVRIQDIEEQAHTIAGASFNMASPRQIQEILFEKLQLPVRSKTPKGQPSTAENVLKELAMDHELPRLILEHRSFSKLRSTYTDKLPELVDPNTGRVHTSYHQAAVGTGRLSSSDPNLQNIPVRTAEGRRIREAFIPALGTVLLSADYSQIELRIMAHLSGDASLMAAFSAEQDIHRATAAEVFNLPLDKVTPDQRRSAKAINFGLIYGMSAFGLARQLGIERAEAQQYIDLYFDRYPGVKTFMDQTRKLAREKHYVKTVFGRRLYLNEINSSNHARRQAAERAAINAPMQGTAADLIKLAMLDIDTWLTEKKLATRIILQVHDELVLEVPIPELEEMMPVVEKLMTGVAELKVPLRVDIGTGENWSEAHS